MLRRRERWLRDPITPSKGLKTFSDGGSDESESGVDVVGDDEDNDDKVIMTARRVSTKAAAIFWMLPLWKSRAAAEVLRLRC